MPPHAHRPFQIVRPNANHGDLELVDEGVEQLQRIEGEVAIIGVVGPYHSGKSFLLNALINMWRSQSFRRTTGTDAHLDIKCHFFSAQNNIFTVGDTVAPKTMGIWLLETDITLEDGTKVLFMDTEGFYGQDVSESYDAKVFTASTLLSSYLLYNSIKLIDQSAVEYVEILARRTQLFQIKNIIRTVDEESISDHLDQLSSSGKQSARSHVLQYNDFPPLTWVVEDFFQDLQGMTPAQWLNQYIDGQRDQSAETKETTLRDVFQRGIDCHTLFLPSSELSELENLGSVDLNSLTSKFIDDVRSLQEKVESNVHVKVIDDERMTGSGVAALLQFILSYINRDTFPKVPSLWNNWVAELGEHSSKEIEHFYNNRMNAFIDKEPPRNSSDLEHRHEELSRNCEKLFKTSLFDIRRLYEPEMKRFYGLIESKHRARAKDNARRVDEYVHKVAEKIRTRAREEVASISVPIDPDHIRYRLENAQFRWAQKYTERLESYKQSPAFDEQRKETQAAIDKEYAEKQSENERYLSQVLGQALVECARQYDKATAYVVERARTNEEMDNAHLTGENACKKEIREYLQKNIHLAESDNDKEKPEGREPSSLEWMSATEAHRTFVKSYTETLNSKRTAARRHNGEAIRQRAAKISADIERRARERHRAIVPFPDEEEIIIGKMNDINVDLAQDYVREMKSFDDTDEYKQVFAKLKARLEQSIKQNIERNVDAVKTYSFEALRCAEERVVSALHETSYLSLWFSWIWFRSWATKEAERCFDTDTNARKFSDALRDKAIEKWVLGDMLKLENNIYLSLLVLLLAMIAVYSCFVSLRRWKKMRDEERRRRRLLAEQRKRR